MRAAIFIDGAYLLKQLQDESLVPDYSTLTDYLLAPLRRHYSVDLLRCYFYDCAPWLSENPTEDERRRLKVHERFVADLHALSRWQMRLGKLERRSEDGRATFMQKRVDVQLSVDLVRHCAAGRVEHVILVAGDSDFIPAVAAAKESGATVTLWCDDDKSVHRDLMLHADEVQHFDWQRFPAKLNEAGQPMLKMVPARRRRRATRKPVLEPEICPKSPDTVQTA